jgi:hypothetical protein
VNQEYPAANRVQLNCESLYQKLSWTSSTCSKFEQHAATLDGLSIPGIPRGGSGETMQILLNEEPVDNALTAIVHSQELT